MMDDDIFDISDGGSSDFVPEPAPVCIDSTTEQEYRIANHNDDTESQGQGSSEEGCHCPESHHQEDDADHS